MVAPRDREVGDGAGETGTVDDEGDADDASGSGLYVESDEEYAGYAMSDEELNAASNTVSGGKDAESAEEWGTREPGPLDRFTKRVFDEDAELPIGLGSGLPRWILTRLIVFLVLVVMVSVIVSAVGWGNLFVGFDGGESSNTFANAASSAAGIVSNLSEAQAFGSQYRRVSVVGVSTGSSFVVTNADGGSVYQVRTIAAVAPPPADGLRESNPARYGLANTSANRTCLSRWGTVSLNYTRSLIGEENVTVVAASVSGGENGSANEMSSASLQGEPYFVVHNNTSVAAELLRRGYARLPEGEFANRANFSVLQKRARMNQSGVWGCPIGPNETN